MNQREARVIEPGLLRIEQRIRTLGRRTGTDTAGPAGVYAVVEITRGTIAYLHGNARIRAPHRFAVFLPPFGIVQSSHRGCDVTSVAWVFRPPAAAAFPSQPLMVRTHDVRQPGSVGDVLDRLRDLPRAEDIGRAPHPEPLAENAKAIIDSEYATSQHVASIAAPCQAPPAVLSRTFKKTYGLPPVRYRHQVRIADALTQFASGAVPADVFLDVGFSDLSRFYKIFRKIACTAPGAYRPGGSRNAKTTSP